LIEHKPLPGMLRYQKTTARRRRILGKAYAGGMRMTGRLPAAKMSFNTRPGNGSAVAAGLFERYCDKRGMS